MKTALKTIRLLRAFNREEPELGVNELARRLEIDPASAHRLLKALTSEGFVEQDARSKKYRLGLAVLEIASSLLQQRGIVDVAMPSLEKLFIETSETVSLDDFNGVAVVCLAALNCPQEVRTTNFIGERTPLHCTSAGLVYLAYMPEAERRRHLAGELVAYTPKTIVCPAQLHDILAEVCRTGISISDETYHSGVRGISAPVLNKDLRVAATISVTAPKQRLTLKKLNLLSKSVKTTADHISTLLGRLDGTGSLLPKHRSAT
jgi:DNA-binding IclR family transcriptional regulator